MGPPGGGPPPGMGPPLGMSPPLGMGGPPGMGGPLGMGGSPGMGGPPGDAAGGVKVQKLKAGDVWSALKSSLKTSKGGQKDVQKL